jgi:integrase
VYFRGKSYWFKNEADAVAKAKDLRGGKSDLTLRESDEYRYARQLLGRVPLLEAVRFYLERNPTTDPTMTVGEAITAHLARATGRPDYMEKKRYFLGIVSERLGNEKLAVVGPASVQALIDSMTSKWGANDVLRHARIFFRDCIRLKLLREDPTAAFQEQKVLPSKVILTVEDTAHILKVCKAQFPEILPAVALQLFTGIRTSEVTRLEWKDVRLGSLVNIEPQVAKTSERRVIDWWPEALTHWMPAKAGEGPVTVQPKSYEAHKWQLIMVCKASKSDFKFGQNAFRHSFASFGCAYFQNAGKVALLMGHRDVNMLFRHYRDYRTKEEADRYFGLRP